MTYTLEIKGEAVNDMQKAFDYYEETKKGLGDRFLGTLENYFNNVQKYPEHYQVKENPIERLLLEIFLI